MNVNLEHVKKRISATPASNRNPLYDSHLYWSQKPYNICDILIDSFSKPGDTVFDPFLGSGVTLLEAVKDDFGRNAVGCEINEAPVFLVRTLMRRYDGASYERTAAELLKKITPLQDYYRTSCPRCGKEGTVTSVLFDQPARGATPSLREVRYRCACTDKGKKAPEEEDFQRMTVHVEAKHIREIPLIPNTKLAVHENETIRCIFTGRNFAVLDAVLGILETAGPERDLFRYLLMSVLHLCKITDQHSNSQWPLWIPKTGCVEKNVLDLLRKKLRRFSSTIAYLGEHYRTPGKATLLHKGCQEITREEVPDTSVQLVITDPPYLGQVAYSEYMQLYQPFLGFSINWKDEIVVSSAPSRRKKEEDYFRELGKAFTICAGKLEDGGFLCMYFHDSSLKVWHRLISLLQDCGLSYLSQVHIAKSNTLKNIISPKKSLNGDCILFFRKESAPAPVPAGTVLEAERALLKKARLLLQRHGALSTPELYDKGLMELLIQNGWLALLAERYPSLVELFEQHFTWNPVTAKWTASSE